MVYIRQNGPRHAKWHLSNPLTPPNQVKLSHGAVVAASDMIGRRILDTLRDSSGRQVVLHEPSLANFVLHKTRDRLATPIYPADASIIVSLLDLHPDRFGEIHGETASLDAPFELFEAGTGVGSLTLHLARAMHAANPPLSPALRRAIYQAKMCSPKAASMIRVLLPDDELAAFEAYRASRRAIIHSVDKNASQRHEAYRFVRSFRRAQYLASIDFHHNNINDYLSERLAQSHNGPFLHRAVLDVPSAQESMHLVIKALHPDSILVVFQPSISQISEIQDWSLVNAEPIRLERVIELPCSVIVHGGTQDGSGGRLWDLRTSVVKSDPSKVVRVMRPKVGDRVVGGGFVAIFRRWPDLPPGDSEAVAHDCDGPCPPDEAAETDHLPSEADGP